MKKLLLIAILVFSTASAIAQTEKGLDIFQKSAVTTSVIDVLNNTKTPTLITKCEEQCNIEFRSCMLVGNTWGLCDHQRAICLFGVDGCFGI